MSAKRIIQVCLILVLLLASFAAISGAGASGYCSSPYRVERGDWLAKIARECGVSLAALSAANPWTRYDRYIYPGQMLVMPGSYPGPHDGPGYCGPSWDGAGAYWVVCRGDTLGRIARYYGVSYSYLQWENGIPNPNRIYPGQVIRP
jgi:tyrosinase